eukprot:10902425-Lingulodinium_polyedra.AAC.1
MYSARAAKKAEAMVRDFRSEVRDQHFLLEFTKRAHAHGPFAGHRWRVAGLVICPGVIGHLQGAVGE